MSCNLKAKSLHGVVSSGGEPAKQPIPSRPTRRRTNIPTRTHKHRGTCAEGTGVATGGRTLDSFKIDDRRTAAAAAALTKNANSSLEIVN